MKIYLSGGAPKPYFFNKINKYLFSFFAIKYPLHRFGTFSDFKIFSKGKK
jgi:hypothetical protein